MNRTAPETTTCTLEIDGRRLAAETDTTVLLAALGAGIYVPHLCHHPNLPSSSSALPAAVVYNPGSRFEHPASCSISLSPGCGLCVVDVAGRDEPQRACELPVSPGLVVRTDTPGLGAVRRQRLAAIFAHHPHACLTCAQRKGCSREPCSSNVPVSERCCSLLGRCELEKVADAVGIPPETPRYVPRGRPADSGDPLIAWAPELCIACLRCVRACGALKGVAAMGYVAAGEGFEVGLVAATRADAGCRYCRTCIEVCPTGSLMHSAPTGGELVPCRSGCPAGMDVPRFLRAAARGDTADAARVALDRLPLPEALGRVCFHPCEASCLRSELGGALSVCRVRRAMFDAASDEILPWKASDTTGKRVAVIGAGPAGLSAAHFLARQGHRVTVFEAAAEAGGMLRYGIPAYRLPREVLDRDLARVLGQGVELRTGITLGRDMTFTDLSTEGFDAVLLAAGAIATKRLGVAGEELAGVLHGVAFLREVAERALTADHLAGRTVLVVGGGNVAIDAARSALRLGAGRVTVTCLEQPDEMPAYPAEIAAARVEGIEILPGWGPVAFVDDGGAVSGARLECCVSVFDAARRFAPRFDPGVTRNVDADTVIVAIGQEVAAVVREDGSLPVRFTAAGFVEVADVDAGTGHPGVFACGDVSLGPSSVVRAIADGRLAAQAIDRFLGGAGEIASLLESEDPEQWIGTAEDFAALPRAAPEEAAIGERIGGFGEVEGSLAGVAARREAGRCLQCDLRLLLAAPMLPPETWLSLDAKTVASVPAGPGVLQLLGSDHVAMRIAGVPNLRDALEHELARGDAPPFFVFEEDPMYTRRESELIQQFLAIQGRMPGGGADDLDDLF